MKNMKNIARTRAQNGCNHLAVALLCPLGLAASLPPTYNLEQFRASFFARPCSAAGSGRASAPGTLGVLHGHM